MLLLVFAEKYISGIADFVTLVEHNAKLEIERGVEPAAAYKWALNASYDLVKEKADQQRAARDALSPPGEALDGRLILPLSKLLDPKTTPFAKRERRNMLEGVDRNIVYVVRNGDAVLYVGCTRSNARRRIRGHLSGKSALGLAIKRESPRSNEWTAEMISHADIKSALETEKRLTEQYKPLYCAAFAKHGESTT